MMGLLFLLRLRKREHTALRMCINLPNKKEHLAKKMLQQAQVAANALPDQPLAFAIMRIKNLAVSACLATGICSLAP